MTESTLCRRPSGQWAIAAPGREPVNIVAGEAFLLEVLGERKLKRVRIERRDGQWRAVLSSGAAGPIERRVELRDGMKAGFFDQRERYARSWGSDQRLMQRASLSKTLLVQRR